MARPVKRRRICQLPRTDGFAPCSVQNPELTEITLDEYEAIRLIDYLGLSQEECAAQMNVARTTVQAIYDAARRKLADMLVNGKRLNISGGHYDLCPFGESCCGKNCARRKWSECGDGCGGPGPEGAGCRCRKEK